MRGHPSATKAAKVAFRLYNQNLIARSLRLIYWQGAVPVGGSNEANIQYRAATLRLPDLGMALYCPTPSWSTAKGTW